MRKIIALLALLALLATFTVSAFADKPSTPFDFKKLENQKNYEYDKFDKTFTYYEAYVKKYSDARLVIGMNLGNTSEDRDTIGATLYVKVMDLNGNNMATAKSIDIMVGDVIYSFESMFEGDDSSTVALGASSVELIKALAEATDVSVRITLNKGTQTFDLDKTDFENSLKKYCKNAVQLGFIDYLEYDTDYYLSFVETLFPITITK